MRYDWILNHIVLKTTITQLELFEDSEGREFINFLEGLLKSVHSKMNFKQALSFLIHGL
jgi:hypothetical protein